MADHNRNPSQPPRGETSELEHDRVRSTNDNDQQAEREGVESEHNRGYDDAVRGNTSSESEEFEDIDPDSANSDVDRNDMIDEP
jgi:hypothetical protein